ncbi:MAG: hypothetical protein J6R98_01840 [Bacteroidaceae bacterium]|nr:hypothetical protein [Bacteroidaceae bacterium]
MALREEEHLIVRWLSQYGPMPKGMIRKLLHYKPSDVVSRILSGLVRYRKIAMIENHKYYAIDRYCTLIPKMHEALCVLLQFAETIDPRSHQIADSPSQIRFAQGNTFYEIIVLTRDEEHLTHLLHPEKNKTFLIVVPDMDFAETLWIPDCHCIFVTLEQTSREFPNVNFYSA